MAARTVIRHVYDTDAGVYCITVGTRVPDQPEDGPVEYVDIHEIVFDANDERWFDAYGNRRADEDVAAEQKLCVKTALDDVPDDDPEPPDTPRELPGVGEEL